MSVYLLTMLLSLVIVGIVGIYIYNNRKKLDEMCCMMVGMTIAAVTGLVVGTYVALPGGDFLGGIIYGTVAGLVFGIPFGRFGGPLGRMEAVMAAPMGGFMGAMTGAMVRVFDIRLFVIFFYAVTIFMMGELAYVVYKLVNERRPNLNELTMVGTLAVAMMFPILIFDYPLEGAVQAPAQQLLLAGNQQAGSNSTAENAATGGVQEVDLRIAGLGYMPNTITLKKGVPARINLKADSNAGCTRAIVFPDFGISRLVPAGGSDTIEFTPNKEGTFRFRCSMGMAWGTLVVKS